MILRPESVESEVLQLTNAFRAEQQLAPLAWHADLARIAKRHAVAVAEGRAPFSHAGARERFSSCSTRCVNVAENLARSEDFGRCDLPEASVAGWRESDGHRRNLLGPFDVVGIGWACSDTGVVFMTQLLALVEGGGHNKWRASTLEVVSSTPAVLATVGLVLAGPAAAIGGAIAGGALQHHGFKVSQLPSVAQQRFADLLKRRFCAGCGGQASGDLLLGPGTDARLFCWGCHPTPTSNDVWCFVE